VSIKVQSYVWEHSKAKGSALLLLLAIADHAHDDGKGAYPGLERLANKCRQTVRNTQILIRKLEEIGELGVSYGTGPHGTNEYTIPMGGENFSPLKTSAPEGEKQVHQISPEPSLTIIKPSLSKGEPPKAKDPEKTPKQKALESLEEGFQKFGGFVPPALIERFYAAFDGNPDHPAERLAHATKKLEETRSFFKAIDAYREWTLPKPQSTYQRPKPGIGRASPPPVVAGPLTDADRKRMVAEHMAARKANGMTVPGG
jgi:hypothetical protein